MASTNDLDRLKKSAQGIQATNDSNSEHFSRDRVVSSEEIKTGLSRLNGSWASEYAYEGDLKLRTGLGLVGFGDIDFIPYIENSNRIGVKGSPSLGSPVSFEVVGPTLKSSLIDWTWALNKTNNTLSLTHVSKTIATEYNLSSSDIASYNTDFGGLYVLIAHVGTSNEKWTSTFSPATTSNNRATTQIFKVESIDAGTNKIVTLSSKTSLSDFFSANGDLAGVVFLRKKSSRMYEVPSSNGTSFFVMPPETTCSLDIEPPLSNWTAGGFSSYKTLSGTSGATTQNASYYGNRVKTAVPTPYSFGTSDPNIEALVEFNLSTVTGLEGGTSFLKVDSSNTAGLALIDKIGVANLVGMCVRINKVSVDDFADPKPTEDQKNSFFGFYEVVGQDTNGGSYRLALRSVTNHNHLSGHKTWFGIGGNFGDLKVNFTIHKSVSQVLTGKNPLTHEIESARVKALISPNLNSNSEASESSSSSLMRGKKCTWVDGEPSNLSELGFGVVVYPAKIDSSTNSLVADFNNPLSSDLYDVDYEGATIYLKSAYSQAPNITDHATNLSKKTVLFISCVALSQEASFGNRFTAQGKGAFSTPSIPQILTSTLDELSDANNGNPSAFWGAGTNSIFIPNLTANQIPDTATLINSTVVQSGGVNFDTKITYRGATDSNNGVLLNNVIADFDYGPVGGMLNDTVKYTFLRNPLLTKEQSDLAGRSVRSETINLTDGSVSYNADGSLSLSVEGLRTEESTFLFDSTTDKWTVDSDSYEVGLEIKRGDLVASNITEIPTTNLEVKPLVLLSSSNVDATDDTHNESMSIDFPAFSDSSFKGKMDLRGFYLNVEGAGVRSKQIANFPDGSRVVLGLDFADTKANPWQSKLMSYKNATGSALTPAQLKTNLDTEIKNQYTDDYFDFGNFFTNSDDCLVISGRSPSVFPAYSYVTTASVMSIVEIVSSGVSNTPAKIGSFKYLLSLEEVGGNKWVTVAVPVNLDFFLAHSLDDMNNDLSNTTDVAKEICDALNEDLYFGHSARLLNRAGFYEGFHQDLSGTDVTVNPSLQAKITAYSNHTVYGERQVLWITVDDPRHSNFGTTNFAEVTIELICTGRGCGKIPFIEGGISVDNLKVAASKSENQLINVIVSLGRAEEGVTGTKVMPVIFDGADHSDYNRIGLYWESSTLPNNTAGNAQTKSVDAQAEANKTVLGFDRNGFLPVGPWLGSSRLIGGQTTSSITRLYLVDDLPKRNEREAGSPIRNRLTPNYYVNDGTKYFDLLPFLENTSGSAGQKNVGESFDFLIQDHWLDNPSFSFNSEDDLTEEDLGLYTWVSRDHVYPTSNTLTDTSYLGLVCTFSSNRREFSSFKTPLSNSPTGHDDFIVTIRSDYFSPSLFSSSVLQEGDEIYFESSVSGNTRRAKAKIYYRSKDGKGKYELQATLKAINGQFGGFSQVNHFRPVFTYSADAFSATIAEFTGSNLNGASLISGNNFYWTSGNLRSLIDIASIPKELTSNETTQNRDTGAIDGGFGAFGSLSASLLTGGRLGLFNGLPQKYSGISFASISGGHSLRGNDGGQDINDTLDHFPVDVLRTYETFLDHGIFPFVSLPKGTGGSFSSTLGSLSRERDKRSDYKSGLFGGSAGLRVSGDIQLFVKNLRVLGSDDNTAFVMHTDFAPPTSTDFLIGNSDVTLDVTSPFLPYNQTGTGPTTSALQAQKSASGFTDLGLKSQGGSHMPSGVGLFGPVSSTLVTDASVRRTATISLGLTLADLKGISKSLGRDVTKPIGATERKTTANFPNQFGSEYDIGNSIFHMAQFSSSEIPSMALPTLNGAYVGLMKYKHSSSPDVDHADNYGIYRIIDTPVLMPVDASDLESGQGSRNTLHGYGHDYSTHTRSSLNTVVANIMVRVESEVVKSVYPDSGLANQGGLSLTPTGLVIDKDYNDNTKLSRKTQRLGHSWRLLTKIANGSFQNIFVFDVMDQGGSPTSSPSDLFGLELNPKALGKSSFPAELVSLATSSNHNSDMPTDLEFAPVDVFDQEEANGMFVGVRLLGVHRNMSHKGKTSSLAFVTAGSAGYVDIIQSDELQDRNPVFAYIDNLKARFGTFTGSSLARLVVYSSERSDRLDESATSTTRQLLDNGETGYVSLGYPERFGLGVVLDGGLGVVSGNAVRVHPQKGNFDSLGSLSVYSSPLMDSRNDLRDGNAVSLPSRFNRTEFYGDVVVAGHDSDLVIDDARTVDGAVARMNEAQASAGTTKNYQSRLLRFRENVSTTSLLTYLQPEYLDILEDSGQPNISLTTNKTLPSYFLNVPPPPLPNDTILPWTNSGIRVKAGGGLVYERPFRPQDATGSDIVASISKGAKSDRGLRGLEIPAFGECLLLPKGPPTLGGRVFKNSAGAKVRTGLTPTDLPLYEFYNGPQAFGIGGDFSVTIGNVFQEHGLYGRDGISEGAVLNSISENKGSFEYGADGEGVKYEFNPGVISQAYRHSRSNQGAWGKGKRKVYLFTAYDEHSEDDTEGFALFYFYEGKRTYIKLRLNTASWDYYPDATAKTVGGSALQTLTDPYSTGKTFYEAALYTNYNLDVTEAEIASAGATFEGFLWDAFFYIPTEVSNIYIETEGNTADGSNPDIALYFSEFHIHRKPTQTTTDPLLFDSTNYPYFDLFPSDASLTPTIAVSPNQKWAHRVVHTNSPHSYDYDINIGYTELEADPNQVAGAVDKRTNGSDWFDLNTSPLTFNILIAFYINGQGSSNYDPALSHNDYDMGFGWVGGSAQSDIPLQVRLIDGMVLEDVTTGSFYSVGEIGRYRGWNSHMKPLGQPGDFTKTNPAFEDVYASLDTDHKSSQFVQAISPIRRPMNLGSMVAINGWSTPEVLYDLSPHYDFETDPSEPYSYTNGFSDVVDGGRVRRPSVGHKFRVVPNVEFVPVLGHRSVKGGLAVPYETDYTTFIKEADAILYDANYSFLKSDIGRKIYICGTYEYAYVGWYAIIDIRKDYIVQDYSSSTITPDTFDVAVVRKIKRSGAYERTWEGENGLALPMRPRKPILEASLDRQDNGRSIFLDSVGNPANLDFHIFDPFTPQGTEHSYVLKQYFDSSVDVGTTGQASSYPTTGIWLGLNVNKENSTSGASFYGVGAEYTELQTEAEKGTYFLVQALNADANFNGVRFGYTFKQANTSTPTEFVGWSDYDGSTPWIKWELKYAYQDKSTAVPVPFDYNSALPVGEGYIICGITCSLQTHLLSVEQRKAVSGRNTFLQVDLLFNSQEKNQYGGASHNSLDALSSPTNLQDVGRGFYFLKGHSTNVDLTWVDKNSYLPNQYVANCVDIASASLGLSTNYAKWTNTTPETTLITESEVQDSTGFTRTSQSASGGVRWVFSAPLLEENVGSYVHLTKQRPYRFGQPTYTQRLRQDQLTIDFPTTENLTNPYGWASGWQRKKDLDSAHGSERIDLSTDIFRVNRCPSTGDLLLGGDCESYSVEDIVCRTRNGYSQRGIEIAYAPLSIGGNWPDSETNELPDTGALNYPILYALQPVARERIVTINPTSATSSILMAHGQYGNAPMVLPASPLAIDTPNALTGNIHTTHETTTDNPKTAQLSGLALNSLSNTYGLFNPASKTDANFHIGFNGFRGFDKFIDGLRLHNVSLDPNYGGKDFVWGERLMMDVSRPWLLMGRETASQTHRFGDINPYSPSLGSVFGTHRTNPRTGNERYNINSEFIHLDLKAGTEELVELYVNTSVLTTPPPIGNISGDTFFDINMGTVTTRRAERNRKPDESFDPSNSQLLQGHVHHQVDDHPSIEGGNSESIGIGDELYARNRQSSGVRQAIYTWTPAGEWWQIQTPVYHGFKSAFVNESTPAPTLKIDLTEAFTQSVSQGSGLNSPYMGRTPRGSRLNRIWVNFGVDGDMSVIPGSPFSEDAKEFSHEGDPTNTISDLETSGLRQDRWGSASGETLVPYNQLRKSNSSITFNLVVELPGSVALGEDHFYMNDNSFYSEAVTEIEPHLSITEFPAAGGSNGSFMGGRLPSGSYNHSSNSNSAVFNSLDFPKKKFMGGTIVVPLYVNREAGDLMPNVMERFVTVGPTRSKTTAPEAKSDWLIGEGKYGLGSIGNNATLVSNTLVTPLGKEADITFKNNFAYLSVNSHNPVVWGGQNFYSSGSITDPKITDLGAEYRDYGDTYEQNLDLVGELPTFDDVRSGNVLASVMPRSSRVGGGVTSSFSSGLYSDLSLFTPEYTRMEMAIHAPATTGITIAHAGGVYSETLSRDVYDFLPNTEGDRDTNPLSTDTYDSLITESEIESGAFGHPKFSYYNSRRAYGRQQAKTSSQCFTLALTPVGDAFQAPIVGGLEMPKIESGSNKEAKNLYNTNVDNSYWDLGRYGRTLNTSTGTDPKDRRFKVGNWLDNILDYYGIPAQSGSMLPTGARVYLEVTVPWPRRPQKNNEGELLYQSSNNGAWISSVKCAFEVETADGTAWTQDVNTMGED